MFLRRRATQAEYFDSPERTAEELQEHYRGLNRINRRIRFERPFRLWIPELLGDAACRRLTLLDLGAADGLLGRELTAWAAQRGWEWEFTNVDASPVAAAMDPGPRHQVASVLNLPFDDASFDVVVASTMTHNLAPDTEVVAHFREADRVARRAVLICDLLRSLPFMAALWAYVGFAGEGRALQSDGALSVRRGWRPEEWRRLATAAGLQGARVWKEHGTRVLLARVKPDRTAGGTSEGPAPLAPDP
ncbi:MAG: methyltransferase domain-containing protein [Xanthomonadales bacterium]|nr:methyltransferase domain-containing protein [Xanthomonadales bacterium]